MLFSDFSFDLPPLLQFVVTALVIGIGLLQVIKVSASRYLVVDARFEGGDGHADMTVEQRVASREQKTSGGGESSALCFVCGGSGTKICTGCRAVRYCSTSCQSKHWKEDHKLKCKDLKFSNSIDTKSSPNGTYLRRKGSGQADNSNGDVPLIPAHGNCKVLQRANKVLFPYEEFVKLFNWDNPGFPPCGLLNCGNSCFANVVLQCLACTRPLVAYLLERGHSQKCNRNDWCFLCELESHIHRVNQSLHPFPPINILSRLPNIGSNLGYGKQEDAHEFMRFAIDTMQSVFLDEFGGESVLDPMTQQTTLIQHIFGGHLQSEVICTKCDNVSYCYENMMDLTVEIQGNAASLENCLDQFTKKEWLDGENMYKCDRCNDYVKAWKRLTVHQAPNILTIALKRFQSGRFGKLNKRVTFPEILDLGPYMSESGNGTDLYRLYAVVVHVDMLNASFFGHYICYTQDFCGNWYRIDDCKVMKVELEEVLAQGAYMLLYSRLHVRQPCLKPFGPSMGEKERPLEVQDASQGSSNMFEQYGNARSGSSVPGDLSSDISLQSSAESADMDLVHPTEVGPDPIRVDQEDVGLDNSQASPSDPACPDGEGLVHLCNEAEKDPSIESMHGESIDSDFLSKQSPAVRSNAMLSQENGISSSADCNDEEVNDTNSNQSNELCSSESPSDKTFPRNSSATSAAPNANLDNVSASAEEANGVLTNNLPTSIAGTTRSGKAFRTTDGVTTDGVRDKSTSSCRRKTLFSPGFLDKPIRKKATQKDDKAQSRVEALGATEMVSSNYSWFSEPGHSHLNDHKVNGHKDVDLDLLPANGMGLPNSKELVMSESPIGESSRRVCSDENWDSNGGTVRISSTFNADCNGISNADKVQVHDVRAATSSGNCRDASLDFRNSEVSDERSELHMCKLEASCNGFMDKAISSHNGSNGFERDKRSITICKNNVISDTSLCDEQLGAEVTEGTGGISRDLLNPKIDSGRAADSTDGARMYGPGACWENGKDSHLNCKRPRQEHD